jgi:hypothetical protein
VVGHGRAFTISLIGAALGLPVLSTVAASHTHSEIASGTSAAMALTDGFQLQFESSARSSASRAP